MRFPTRKLGLQYAIAIAVVGLAGCGDDGSSGGGAGSCTPGQVDFCPCPGDAATSPSGTQTCLADGTFGMCGCGDVATGGGDTDDSAGDTAESDSDSQGNGTTGPDLCGNGFPDPGECDVGPDGVMVPCPEDCQSAEDSGDDTDSMGTTGPVDACAGVPIYVGMTAPSASEWTHPGFGEGFTSGTQACIALGYEGVCTYTQLTEASAQGDFAAVPAGTTYWVHRVQPAMVDGMLVQPDTRSRCDDWRYNTNDVNDGEYATVNAGALDFTLDPDPLPNGPNDARGLDCGPATLVRAIPCCNTCVE